MNRVLGGAVVVACLAFFARQAWAIAPNVAFGGEHTIVAADLVGGPIHTITLANPPLANIISAQVQVIQPVGNKIAVTPGGPVNNPNADIAISWVIGSNNVVVSDPNNFNLAVNQKIRWIAYGPPAGGGALAVRGGAVIPPAAPGAITILTGLGNVTSAMVQLIDSATALTITNDISVSFAPGGKLVLGNGTNRILAPTQTIRWIAVGN